MHDIVIRGGTLVDGTGAPGRPADVAVTGSMISGIGDHLRGLRTIDAAGLVVAPGFIDLHTHVDFTLRQSPGAMSQLAQGVTTLVGGNCGYSPFPATDLNRAASGAEDRFAPEWADLKTFADAVQAAGPAVNLALQVGHNTVRSAELGTADRAPTADELDRMRRHVTEAATQGAFGISTGLVYPPGLFASTSEVVALVAVAAAHGLLYSTHVRNETGRVVDAVDEAIEVARQAGARLEVSHLKGMGPRALGLSRVALSHLLVAQADGMDVGCDVYPYTASSTSLASRLPSWALDGGTAALESRLADAVTRERIVGALDERFGRDIDPSGIVLAELRPGPYEQRAGQSVVDVARDLGVSSAEAVVRVLAAHGDVAIVNHAIDEDDLRHVLADPATAIGSDGWIMDLEGPGLPHPRSFGTFARVLGVYVRETGLLTWEDAIRKMTSLPASRLGITDRGRVEVGLVADLTVFDPDRVADTATYDRPWRAAVGTETVMVSGMVAYEHGSVTGERAGRVLRHATPT